MRGNVIIPYVVLDQNTVAAKQFCVDKAAWITC